MATPASYSKSLESIFTQGTTITTIGSICLRAKIAAKRSTMKLKVSKLKGGEDCTRYLTGNTKQMAIVTFTLTRKKSNLTKEILMNVIFGKIS